MYYHMVGRAAPVISPFYSLLPDSFPQRMRLVNFRDGYTELYGIYLLNNKALRSYVCFYLYLYIY